MMYANVWDKKRNIFLAKQLRRCFHYLFKYPERDLNPHDRCRVKGV